MGGFRIDWESVVTGPALGAGPVSEVSSPGAQTHPPGKPVDTPQPAELTQRPVAEVPLVSAGSAASSAPRGCLLQFDACARRSARQERAVLVGRPIPVARGRALALAVILLLVATPRAGYPLSEQVPIGARAIGMGGAFSSLADDGSALFWNPAGLARIGQQEVMGTHANLFNTGINDDVFAFVLPLSLNQVAAADWYHSGFNDSELDFGENRFDLSYGVKVNSYLMAGATVKYLRRDTNLDGTSVRRGSGTGMDLGVLASPVGGLRLALMGQDVFDTRLTYGSGEGTAVAFPRNVRGAASYSFRRRVIVATDVDDRWHVGLEYAPMEQLALRAGMEKDRRGSEAATYTAGTGFKVRGLRFDYAYVMPPELSATSHFTVSYGFNFNGSQVRLGKPKLDDLYPSLYKSYGSHPFGSVQAENIGERPLEATIGVYVPDLMSAPSESTFTLDPKNWTKIPLFALLAPKAMSQVTSREVLVRVTSTYKGTRYLRTDKVSARCWAFAPGELSWEQGVAPAAAFITANDPEVAAFTSRAWRVLALESARSFPTTNLGIIAAILDALSTVGVTYKPDPDNSYSRLSETPRAVDVVQYPRETLAKGTGDCDDISVLVAALLQNAGIRTKLVDVPGHIFVLADAGVHERNRMALGVSENLYVIRDNEVWIPLETTMTGKRFTAAWKEGADVYRSSAEKREVKLVDVDSAQTRFQPADAPQVNSGPPKVPDPAALRDSVAADARVVELWRDEYLKSRFAGAEDSLSASPRALVEVAHLYILSGELDDARSKLEQAFRRQPSSASVQNNLAVAYGMTGDLTRALEHFEAAARLDPSDAGVWLNLGLARWAAKDSIGSRKALGEGVSRIGGYEPACRLIGLRAAESADRQGLEEITSAEARALLMTAAGSTTSGAGSRHTAAPIVWPTRGQGETTVLESFFYWKE